MPCRGRVPALNPTLAAASSVRFSQLDHSEPASEPKSFIPLALITAVTFGLRRNFNSAVAALGFRSGVNGSQSSEPRLACERDRGHGAPQPQAQRAATAILHALLGKRRGAEARQGRTRSAR